MLGPGHGANWEGNIQYSDNDENGSRTAARSFAHQIHDQDRTLAIEASYHVPVATYGRIPVILKDPISLEESKLYIQFGTLYEGRLESEYITYYLRLKYFNGKEFKLQEGSTYDNMLLKTINKSGYKTLTIQVNSPY